MTQDGRILAANNKIQRPSQCRGICYFGRQQRNSKCPKTIFIGRRNTNAMNDFFGMHQEQYMLGGTVSGIGPNHISSCNFKTLKLKVLYSFRFISIISPSSMNTPFSREAIVISDFGDTVPSFKGSSGRIQSQIFTRTFQKGAYKDSF